jgi:HK97 family phage major capsid protein
MDPKKLEELLAGLTKSNQALTETITARLAVADPKAREEEKKALVDEVLKGLSALGLRPPEPTRKMAWATPGMKTQEGVEAVPFNRFLKAVWRKDDAFLEKMGSFMEKTATGQSEGTAADGGNVVPVEYANEIIKLERQSGIIRGLARIFPMGSLSRKVPRELTKPAVYWTGEGAEPTKSTGTTTQITQTAKKLNAIVAFTEELLEDNNVSYDQFIAQVVAEEMGREEDKIALAGSVTGNTDPFNGVLFASGTNSVSLDGATLKFGDIVNLLMAPKAPYRERGVFCLSTTALKKIMKLVDDNGDPIWTMPDSGNPGRILGKVYYESDQIPDTLNGSTDRTTGTQTALVFGDFGRGLWISPRGSYTVKASDSASDSGGKSAFTLDEVWFKFRRRQDISVANPEAFSKLLIPAA